MSVYLLVGSTYKTGLSYLNMAIIFFQQEDMERPRELTFERDPPSIEWHITGDPNKFDILTV